MAKDNDGLTPLQHAFIDALLTGKNISQAARIAGCSSRAALYWLSDPDCPVKAVYEERRAALTAKFDERIAKLHDLTLNALEDLLSKKTPPFIRVQAVKMLYEAHLQEHGNVKQPGDAKELIGSEAEAYYNAKRQESMINVLLYDDKGKERIGDDIDD